MDARCVSRFQTPDIELSYVRSSKQDTQRERGKLPRHSRREEHRRRRVRRGPRAAGGTGGGADVSCPAPHRRRRRQSKDKDTRTRKGKATLTRKRKRKRKNIPSIMRHTRMMRHRQTHKHDASSSIRCRRGNAVGFPSGGVPARST